MAKILFTDSSKFMTRLGAGARSRPGIAVAVMLWIIWALPGCESLSRSLKQSLSTRTVAPVGRPEVFARIVEDSSLIDRPEPVTDPESRHFRRYPLISGGLKISYGPLAAGTGKADLLEGWTGPLQMASYGPFPGVANGIREPVYARALVLDNGSTRIAIVSCDLLLMDLPFREKVLQKLRDRGIALDDILLAATHTHTSVGGYVDHWPSEVYILGPFQEATREHLVERVVEAIGGAAIDLKPARLGVGRAFVHGLSYNRRLGTTVDPELGIIKVAEATGKPLAVVTVFGAHPVLEPRDFQISPDYPGLLARALDERYGFGLFLAGALGDVNATVGGTTEGQTTPEFSLRRLRMAGEAAAILAREVEKVYETIPTRREVDLGSVTMLMDTPPVNFNQIPDLFFPLDWLLALALQWPKRVPLQTVKLGDTAIIACSTEVSARLGLQIKRRSPSRFPFVVTHANSYGGYAVTQTLHALRKLDPTSMASHHGSTYGARVVEASCDLLEAQWRERLDPTGVLLSPAATALLEEKIQEEELDAIREARRAQAIEREEQETLVRADPTVPQSRRFGGAVTDTIPDWVRVETSFQYLSDLRGGNRVEGRRRDYTVKLQVEGPWKLRLDVEGGYRRSDWKTSQKRDADDGDLDLTFGVDRPFLLFSSPLDGTALRATPRLAFTAPTGDADTTAPFAFASSTGVLQIAPGGALELTWETYRTITLESVYKTAVDRYKGRKPGDRWESSLGYRERHGFSSLSLDLSWALQLPDSRKTGRTEVDVEDPSFELYVHPGISFHLGKSVELFTQGQIPLAKTGPGAGGGRGVLAGLIFGF